MSEWMSELCEWLSEVREDGVKKESGYSEKSDLVSNQSECVSYPS